MPSLLHPPADAPAPAEVAPPSFRDLNLDQVEASLVAGRAEYHLEEYFRTPLRTGDAVRYRHAALRDLERPETAATVRAFADGMRTVRAGLRGATGDRHELQRRLAFLTAATSYVATAQHLAEGLAAASPTSAGLTAFAAHAADLVASPAFLELSADAESVTRTLDAVTYRLHITSGRVTVSRPVDGERDHTWVASVFEPFRDDAVAHHRAKPSERGRMTQVEEAVADRVARLYPEPFAALERFCARHEGFVDPDLRAADRELQFYLAGLEFAARLRAAGLPLCLPDITEDGGIDVVDAFDPALALRRGWDGEPVVLNDVALTGTERVLLVTGPNQGGKTTFARMVGQVAWLAGLGLPVPGRHARVSLPDRILTHFERGENRLRGALEDDLVRVRDLLDAATGRSLIILNEVFTSTSVQDAVLLSTEVLRRVVALDCPCVCVTFLDELVDLSPTIVGLVSQVDPDDPAIRTFKVVRQHTGGPTHAETLALRHGLDYTTLRERLAR